MNKKVIIYSLNELTSVAQNILKTLNNYHTQILAFYGKMGAGKTTLIKAICEQLGVTDTVQSPSFAIINQYQLKNGESIYHFDFYRIEKLEDAINIGVEDYFYSDSLCLIEWPEIIEIILPKNTLKLQIEIIDEKKRKIII